MSDTSDLRKSSLDIQASHIVWFGSDVMMGEIPLYPYSWPGKWGNV